MLAKILIFSAIFSVRRMWMSSLPDCAKRFYPPSSLMNFKSNPLEYSDIKN